MHENLNDAPCSAHIYELDESDDDLKKEDISFGPLGLSDNARSISLTPGSLLHGRQRPPSTSQVGWLNIFVYKVGLWLGHPVNCIFLSRAISSLKSCVIPVSGRLLPPVRDSRNLVKINLLCR